MNTRLRVTLSLNIPQSQIIVFSDGFNCAISSAISKRINIPTDEVTRGKFQR